MNAPFTPPEEETYQPTPAEMRMAQSINFLVSRMLAGELHGVALAAINVRGEDSCFYYNKPDKPVLRSPMERLKVMYETNQSFRALDNTPENNRSYRMN